MLQSLLLRLPRLQERVANAVTFPTCQRADHNSDPVGNGDGGPESGATAPIFGAHGANRKAYETPQNFARAQLNGLTRNEGSTKWKGA